jgi:hypothetical protein
MKKKVILKKVKLGIDYEVVETHNTLIDKKRLNKIDVDTLIQEANTLGSKLTVVIKR